MGFRCGQQSPQPATTSLGFDRKAARNPQLHIVPSVMGNHKGLRKKMFNDRFSVLYSGCFSFRADSFPRRTFPRLTVWCLREKAKRWSTALRVSTESFSFRQRIFKNCSADSFSGLDSFVFHFGGQFHRQNNFDDDF